MSTTEQTNDNTRRTLELSRDVAMLLADRLPGAFNGKDLDELAILIKVSTLTLGGAVAAALPTCDNAEQVDTLFKHCYASVEKTAEEVMKRVMERANADHN